MSMIAINIRIELDKMKVTLEQMERHCHVFTRVKRRSNPYGLAASLSIYIILDRATGEASLQFRLLGPKIPRYNQSPIEIVSGAQFGGSKKYGRITIG